MASAEQLLQEAQYAFASISFGESLNNTRNALRAKSLCRKIIRRFPTTMEAQEARAILQRLGEEAYTAQMPNRHVHNSQRQQVQPPPVDIAGSARGAGQGEALNWAGLLGLVFGVPKALLFIIFAFGFVLFSIFGPFLVLPLIALVLFTGPMRSMLGPDTRRQVNGFVVSINRFIDERRGSA